MLKVHPGNNLFCTSIHLHTYFWILKYFISAFQKKKLQQNIKTLPKKFRTTLHKSVFFITSVGVLNHNQPPLYNPFFYVGVRVNNTKHTHTGCEYNSLLTPSHSFIFFSSLPQLHAFSIQPSVYYNLLNMTAFLLH